jgi:hypothetical protein
MVRLLSAWRRDLVCRDAVALMTDYLEGALSPRQLARLQRHLAGCDGCDEYQPEDLASETRQGLMDLFLHYRENEGDGDDVDDDDGGNT